MPSYVPPKKNAQFIFYLSLVSQADTKLFQTNPTLAAGDVKVSTDGSNPANITTLPTVINSTELVKVTVSAAEMNGDNISINFSDVAGGEWCDRMVNIQTTDSGYTVQTGDTYALLTGADTELSSVPTTTASIINKIKFLFEYFRHKRTADSDTETLFKENSSDTLGTASLSKTGDLLTKGKMS